MERRKFITGLGALATGSAAAMGTGAFSSVSADRSLSVNVADDSSAFLAIKESGGPNSAYVDTSGDAIAFTLDSSSGADGNGVNADSYTVIRNVFEIHNQGTQEVQVWAENVPDDTVAIGFDSTYYNANGTARDESNYDDASHDMNISNDVFNGDASSTWNVDDRLLVPSGEAQKEGYLLIRGDVTDIDQDITLVAKTQNELEDY